MDKRNIIETCAVEAGGKIYKKVQRQEDKPRCIEQLMEYDEVFFDD